MFGLCISTSLSVLCLSHRLCNDQEHRGLLSVRYPMEHGIVNDWNDMERIWQYVYSKEQLQTFSEEVSCSFLLLLFAACPLLFQGPFIKRSILAAKPGTIKEAVLLCSRTLETGQGCAPGLRTAGGDAAAAAPVGMWIFAGPLLAL